MGTGWGPHKANQRLARKPDKLKTCRIRVAIESCFAIEFQLGQGLDVPIPKDSHRHIFFMANRVRSRPTMSRGRNGIATQ